MSDDALHDSVSDLSDFLILAVNNRITSFRQDSVYSVLLFVKGSSFFKG